MIEFISRRSAKQENVITGNAIRGIQDHVGSSRSMVSVGLVQVASTAIDNLRKLRIRIRRLINKTRTYRVSQKKGGLAFKCS